MNNVPWWIPVGVSLLALIPGLYAALVTFRTRRREKSERDNVVFRNALELLEENRKESKLLRVKLDQANRVIDQLNEKLTFANGKINQLTEDLTSANTELYTLRGQIESLSKQVDGDKH